MVLINYLQNWKFYLSIIITIYLFCYWFAINNYSISKKILDKVKNLNSLDEVEEILLKEKMISFVNEISANSYDGDKKKIIKDFRKILDENILFSKVKLLEGLPQLFLTIGVLGTFIGLSIGLSRLGDINLTGSTLGESSLNSDLTHLLSGIKLSFLSSIIGIISSIVASGTNLLLYNKCEKTLLENCGILNRKFYINSPEKEIADKIGNELSAKLEAVLTTKISELLEDNLEMIEDLSDSIQKQSVEVKNTSKEFINKMGNLSEIFKTSFKTSVKEIFDEDFISNIKKIQNRLETRFDSSDKTFEMLEGKINKSFKSVEVVSEKSQELSLVLESIFSNVNESSNEITKNTKKITDDLETLVEKTTEVYNPLLHKSAELIDKNQSIVNNLQDDIDKNSKIISDFNNNMNNIDILKLSSVINGLEDSIEDIIDSVNDFDKSGQKLNQGQIDIIDKVAMINREMPVEEFNEISKLFLSGVSSIKNINSELKKISESFSDIQINKTVDQVEKTTEEIRNLNEAVEKFTDDFEENSDLINQTLSDVNNKFVQTNGNVDNTIRELEDSLEDIEEISVKYKSISKELKNTV